MTSTTIQIGDPVPKVTLRRIGANGPEEVDFHDIIIGKKVLLFAIPGAFTPTCSDDHAPGYIKQADAIKDKGIDAIICVASNDPFVVGAWAKVLGAGEAVQFLSDGNGDFARALGVLIDLSHFGLGHRSSRYAMLIDNGIVKQAWHDDGPSLLYSKAQSVLEHL